MRTLEQKRQYPQSYNDVRDVMAADDRKRRGQAHEPSIADAALVAFPTLIMTEDGQEDATWDVIADLAWTAGEAWVKEGRRRGHLTKKQAQETT